MYTSILHARIGKYVNKLINEGGILSKKKETSVFTARMETDTKEELNKIIDQYMKRAGLNSKTKAFSLLVDTLKDNYNSLSYQYEEKLPDIKPYVKSINLALDTIDQAKNTINTNLSMILATYSKSIYDLISENETAQKKILELETEVKELKKD